MILISGGVSTNYICQHLILQPITPPSLIRGTGFVCEFGGFRGPSFLVSSVLVGQLASSLLALHRPTLIFFFSRDESGLAILVATHLILVI